jgi:hypothetical protein
MFLKIPCLVDSFGIDSMPYMTIYPFERHVLDSRIMVCKRDQGMGASRFDSELLDFPPFFLNTGTLSDVCSDVY